VVSSGIAFVLGFSMVFVALFYVLRALEVTLLIQHQREVNFVAGLLVIVLALQTIGVLRIGSLMRERRFHLAARASIAGGFLLGVTFAAGWTPCIGPQLAAILQLAVGGDFGGLPFVLVYCLGLGVPFLIVAGLIDRVQGPIRGLNRHL
jgi:cytochrome c-type biogenesis protein